MVVKSFLTGLPSKFKTAKSRILSSLGISSFQDVFSRVFRTIDSPLFPSSDDLVSQTTKYESRRSYYIGGNKGRTNSFDRTQSSRGIMCHYCHKLGYMKRDFKDYITKLRKLTRPYCIY